MFTWELAASLKPEKANKKDRMHCSGPAPPAFGVGFGVRVLNQVQSFAQHLKLRLWVCGRDGHRMQSYEVISGLTQRVGDGLAFFAPQGVSLLFVRYESLRYIVRSRVSVLQSVQVFRPDRQA